jgi:hypothetical protein
MKKEFTIMSTIILLLTISCSSPNKKEKADDIFNQLIAWSDSVSKADSLQVQKLIKDYDLNRKDTYLVGDIDGNGIKDSATIQPLNLFFHNNKIDSQFVYISFTCNVPKIKYYGGFQGLLVDLGDLDGNKTEEIMYYPYCIKGQDQFIIYGYKQDKWIEFARGFIRREILKEQKDPIKYLKSKVKKINNKSFELTQEVWSEKKEQVEDLTSTEIIK